MTEFILNYALSDDERKMFYEGFFYSSSKDTATYVNHEQLQPCIFITHSISALPFTQLGQ